MCTRMRAATARWDSPWSADLTSVGWRGVRQIGHFRLEFVGESRHCFCDGRRFRFWTRVVECLRVSTRAHGVQTYCVGSLP
jgi:hypothetical protein